MNTLVIGTNIFDYWYLFLVAIIIILLLVLKFIKKDKVPEIKKYNIVFDSQMGINVDSIEVEEGSLLPELPIIERNGYKFLGWCIDSKCTSLVSKKTIITEDICLYGKWEKLTIDEFLSQMNVENIQKDIIKKIKSTYKKDE